MYDLVLLLHSWLRWVALAAGIAATLTAFTSSGTTEGRGDRWGVIFVGTLDLQLLLGLLLYFGLSPITAAIREDFGAALRDPGARFWAVEHIGMMLLAIVLAHLGRVLAKKARTGPARRARLLACFALSTIALIAATPWPGMTAGRPLFRF